MIISIRHRFTLLSMPKCGTTALTRAMAPHADIVIEGTRAGKHTRYQEYRAGMAAPIAEKGGDIATQETLSVMRDPVDYVRSWWRYRARDQIVGKPKSTRDTPFAAFLADYLRDYEDGKSTRTGIGWASRFVKTGRTGDIGVDRMFRYPELDRLVAWVEARTGWGIELRRANVSPRVALDDEVPPALMDEARSVLAREYALYARADGGFLDPPWRRRQKKPLAAA